MTVVEIPDEQAAVLKAKAALLGLTLEGWIRKQAEEVAGGKPKPKKSAYGLLAKFRPGPSAEEIDQNRKERICFATSLKTSNDSGVAASGARRMSLPIFLSRTAMRRGDSGTRRLGSTPAPTGIPVDGAIQSCIISVKGVTQTRGFTLLLIEAEGINPDATRNLRLQRAIACRGRHRAAPFSDHRMEQWSAYDLVAVGSEVGPTALGHLVRKRQVADESRLASAHRLPSSAAQQMQSIRAVSLSRAGTKALVRCAGSETVVWVDLTSNTPGYAELERHSHRDPDQLYFLPAARR